MSRRILVLSDTHLGRPKASAGSARALRGLWKDFDEVVVNGDVAEVHHPRHRVAACREVIALQELAEADGVQLTLVSGNHDPLLSDQRHLHLAGGSVFVTHGDALHPSIAPWSPACGRLRRAFRAAIEALPPSERNDLHKRLSAAQHASLEEWLELEARPRLVALRATVFQPWFIFKVLRYWRAFPRLAVAFADIHAPQARFLLLGHTHHQEVRELDGRVIINTGSFGFPGRPLGVSIDGDTLAVHRILPGDHGYRLDEATIASYALAAPPEPAVVPA